MAKKRIPFMPLETVTFECVSEDGTSTKDIDFTFNNYAIMTLTQEFGGMNKLFKEYENKPYDITAMLLYAGVKPNMTDFTLDEARAVVASGGTVIIEEVTRLVVESLMILGGDDAKKKFIANMKIMGLIQ